MKKFLISSVFLAIVFAWGCDIVEAPYMEKPTNGNDTTKVYRKVLLEDYTGHRCNNCPTAAVEAKSIVNTYGDKVIVMAVHATFLAVPTGTTYSYDFRTSEGTDYASTFGISAVPAGMINRKQVNGNFVVNYSAWAAGVDSLIYKEASIKIEIDPSYNSSNRQLAVEVNTEFLEALTGDYKLVVLVLESGIIKPQLNNNASIGDVPDILNYEHNHVLRGSMNGAWGENIALTTDTKNYSLTLSTDWNADNMAVLAYVYRDDNTDGNRYEVMQVEETDF